MENHSLNERDDRLKKLEQFKKAGINPYPSKSVKQDEASEIVKNFDELVNNEREVKIAGRIRTKRSHGNLSFVNLDDGTAQIQLAFSKKEIKQSLGNTTNPNYDIETGVGSYQFFDKLIDIGDFIEVGGICFLTHKGEKTVMVKYWNILSKAIRPLPEKWHGLSDEEEKFRKRYLDILFNEEIKDLFKKKAVFWQSVREFLTDRDFLEVETPALEVTTGGADAKPFNTHHNALDMKVYLRISMGELWQKRLMIAGYPKTFEIGRQFRNEGMDAEHLQDYSQMEFYWAYADYEQGMKLVEDLYKFVALKTFGTLKFKIKNFDIDLGKTWKKLDYRETVLKMTKVDILNTNEKEVEKKLHLLNIEYDKKGFNITRAIDNLWKFCRKQIPGPGFLTGVPIIVSPLAKKDELHPELTQRFQPIIAGSELGNGYSELNDPIDQAERFAAQQKLREAGDEEAQMFDHEFVEALEYGMPPTCGFGMSERVFSVLAGKTARECQIFPLMKPKQ